MTYDQLLETVINSHSDDWNVITCWGAFSGPSYRSHPAHIAEELNEIAGEGRSVFTEHGMTASYKRDLAVTIAWGITSNNDFRTEWANREPDPHASSCFADLFYNGALVHRQIYVVVDGGRSYLPLPNHVGGTEVDRVDYEFVRLVDELEIGRISEYEAYFRRSGLTLAAE